MSIEMSEKERRETVLDTFASWQLEGMEPDAQDVQDAKDYIAGRATLDEILERTLARFRTA